VNWSPGLRWLVVLLLPLTLVWKLTDTPDDPTELKAEIVGFLARHHFDVTIMDQNIDRMPMIRATRGACSMVLAKASAYGWSQDILRNMAGENPILVLFRGKFYSKQPVFRTYLAHLWSRSLRSIGLAHQITPVIAVIAPASCEVEALPWSEIRELGAS